MRLPLTEELARQVEKRIDELCAARPIGDQFAYKIANVHRSLPLFRTTDAYYALSLAGELLKFSFRRFDDPMPELQRGRTYGAIAIGARRYPELAVLLPVLKLTDVICVHCRGSGQHPLAAETGDERVVCECGGFGFIPADTPEEAEQMIARSKSTVFPDIVPSTYKRSYFYEICAEHTPPRTEEALTNLVETLFDETEADCFYFRPKDGGGSELIERALADGVLTTTEQEFFYYEHPDRPCDFIRVEPPRADDSDAEFMFGYQKRDVLFRKRLSAGRMHVRTKLLLTERTKRKLEIEAAKSKSPFEAKLKMGPLSVDLIKLPSWLRQLVRKWRARRNRRLK